MLKIDIYVDDEYVETIEQAKAPEGGDVLEGAENTYVVEECYRADDVDADYVAECSLMD